MRDSHIVENIFALIVLFEYTYIPTIFVCGPSSFVIVIAAVVFWARAVGRFCPRSFVCVIVS